MVDPRWTHGDPRVDSKVSLDVLNCTKCPKCFKLLSVSACVSECVNLWVIELLPQLKIVFQILIKLINVVKMFQCVQQYF